MPQPELVRLKVPQTIFGPGAVGQLGSVVAEFAPTKVMMVTDPGVAKAGIAARVQQVLAEAGYQADLFDKSGTEAPVSIIDQLVAEIRRGGHDLLIGVGGGSSMDTTKAAAIFAADPAVTVQDLVEMKPITKTMRRILIPTTAGTGSEWSATAVITDDLRDGRTYPIVDDMNFPDAVLIDPELSLGLPSRPTAHTGMDALTHAIEAYTCSRATVVSDMFAAYAIGLISGGLRPAVAKGSRRLEERSQMAFAAACAMMAGALAGVGLAHFMNVALGKKAGISHGAAVSLMLPHVMEFNMIACPEKFAEIARLLGEKTEGLPVHEAAGLSVKAVKRLLSEFRMPQTLGDVGLAEADIPELVDELMTYQAFPIAFMNPREADAGDAAFIYRRAL